MGGEKCQHSADWIKYFSWRLSVLLSLLSPLRHSQSSGRLVALPGVLPPAGCLGKAAVGQRKTEEVATTANPTAFILAAPMSSQQQHRIEEPLHQEDPSSN